MTDDGCSAESHSAALLELESFSADTHLRDVNACVSPVGFLKTLKTELIVGTEAEQEETRE